MGGAIGKIEEGGESSKIVSAGYLTSFFRGRNLFGQHSRYRDQKDSGLQLAMLTALFLNGA